MRPELKPNIEPILFSLAYLEHLSKQGPEFKRAVELLPILNRIENIWEEILRMKGTLELAVEIPEYKFSNILTKKQYEELTIKSINDIQTNYLNFSNNKLSESDKIYIINGLKDFYKGTEYSIIPFYNQYCATKHDRVAYMGLSFLYFFSQMIQLFYLVQEKKTATDNKLIDIKNKINSINGVFEIEESEMEKTYSEMKKVHEKMPSEGFEMVKNILMLPPEKQAELEDSQMFSGLDLAAVFDEDYKLDNKALDSHYIKIIFKRIQKSLPNLTLHRQYILTGYVALNFGIIKESEFQPAFSSYKSLTQFLRDRVKGILKNG
jgi:hypothetical protein